MAVPPRLLLQLLSKGEEQKSMRTKMKMEVSGKKMWTRGQWMKMKKKKKKKKKKKEEEEEKKKKNKKRKRKRKKKRKGKG